MSHTEVHVRPLPDGAWGVCLGDRAEPASCYLTASDAEREAVRLLLAEQAFVEVVIHDLYHRQRHYRRRARDN
jgi:hypothetical protein